MRPRRGEQERAREDAIDRDLMARHVSGDPDAFSELFNRHRDRLWAVALRTLSRLSAWAAARAAARIPNPSR